MILFIFICFFLCWGSFLNVIAYRLAHDKSFLRSRSFCPHCDTIIAWYDNLPLISWILLKGRCRTCKNSISLLYPFIELVTGLALTKLAMICLPSTTWTEGPALYELFHTGFIGYALFISALIVCTRTDLEIMMVPQLCTLWLVPVALGLSFAEFSGLSWHMSLTGAVLGYATLWLINYIFYALSGKNGIGEGDMDMMALIGAFLGTWGAWISLLIGSIIGSVFGVSYLWWTGQGRNVRIPFGPLLALGAIIFLLYENQLSWLWS